MRTFGKMVLACGLVGLLVAPAQAQRPGGGRGFGMGMGGGGGGVMLLANKSVQEELKVDSAQAEKLNAFAEQMREKQRAQMEKLQDVPQDERREKMAQFQRETMTEVQKNVTEILKPEQAKRFQQIQLQQMGVLGAPMMPRVQEALNLTEDQRTKFRTIMQEQQESMRELFQGGGGGDREAARQKMMDLRKKGEDKAMAVLTDSQKASWKELTGAPFEVKFEPGQGPGGGRPGGGGRQRNNNNNN